MNAEQVRSVEPEGLGGTSPSGFPKRNPKLDEPCPRCKDEKTQGCEQCACREEMLS